MQVLASLATSVSNLDRLNEKRDKNSFEWNISGVWTRLFIFFNPLDCYRAAAFLWFLSEK